MDQCVEYVYILSANFTQRRRSVGGGHKPFPPDGEAHPSLVSSCLQSQTDRDSLMLHWATQLLHAFPVGPRAESAL